MRQTISTLTALAAAALMAVPAAAQDDDEEHVPTWDVKVHAGYSDFGRCE